MMRFRSVLTAAALAALAGLLMNCQDAGTDAPAGAPVDTVGIKETRVKVLGPRHGSRYAAKDTVLIP